jgi:hypothetical protein
MYTVTAVLQLQYLQTELISWIRLIKLQKKLRSHTIAQADILLVERNGNSSQHFNMANHRIFLEI